ncbi:MAG: DMT family transporter, partial [Arenicellales bacterium]
ITVAFIWGGTFIAGRQLAIDVPPLLSAFFRFLIACIVLSIISPPKRKHFQLIKDQHWQRIFLMGLTGVFFYNVCFFYGFQYISASRGSLIVALNPTVIGLVSFLFFNEKIGPIRWLGIILSLLGVSVVIIGNDPQALSMEVDAWKGDLLILGCVASWATYSIVAKPVIDGLGATSAVFYSLLVGTALLFLLALSLGDLTFINIKNIGLTSWGSLLFLGGLGSAVAYVLYYKSIGLIGATSAGVYIALVPIFGVSLGALLLDEKVTLSLILGGAAATIGVYLSSFNHQKQKAL